MLDIVPYVVKMSKSSKKIVLFPLKLLGAELAS